MPGLHTKVESTEPVSKRPPEVKLSSRAFVWRKHGRKKLVGYSPALDFDVTITRTSSGDAPGYSIETKLENRPVDLGAKFPNFAASLKGAHTGYPSAWAFFMTAFDRFGARLMQALHEKQAQPTPERPEFRDVVRVTGGEHEGTIGLYDNDDTNPDTGIEEAIIYPGHIIEGYIAVEHEDMVKATPEETTAWEAKFIAAVAEES